MFCKVCKDAKKSESVYTSHQVRDTKGKVVCPTLLSQKCKFCKEKGHTPKHCPKLEGRYKAPAQQHQAQQHQAQQRARELCSSPPPAPFKGEVIPFNPTPIGKKTNYFQLLKVDEETSVVTAATFKENYLDIAKECVERFKCESKKTKDAEIETYKKDLEKNFPALGEEKTMKNVDAVFTTGQSYSSKASTATAPARARARYEREDSPTPSPVSSQPHTPPPAPKKMPQVKEEEEDTKCYPSCGGCKQPYDYGCDDFCMGTPSPSPSPPPPTTTWTSWADVE